MRRPIFVVLLCASFAFPCDNPQLRSVRIGGDVLQATAISASGKPIRFAKVRLYRADKLAWSGATNKDGAFTIDDLRSGRYGLSVSGWGKTIVELDPNLDELSNHQRPSYNLRLAMAASTS